MARASLVAWTKGDVAYHLSVTPAVVDALIELGMLTPVPVIERFRPEDVRRVLELLAHSENGNSHGKTALTDKSGVHGRSNIAQSTLKTKPGRGEIDIQQTAKELLRRRIG